MSDDNEKMGQDRKEKLLMLATELFAEEGYSAVSTRKISELAGCNLAAISYYFGGKEKLYAECLRRLEPEAYSEMVEILKPADSRETLEGRLLKFCQVFCGFVSRNSAAVKLLINELNSSKRNVELDANFLDPILEKLEEFFQSGIDRKIVSPHVEPKLITRMIFSVIVTQIIYRSFETFENISYEAFAKKIVANCTGSFYV